MVTPVVKQSRIIGPCVKPVLQAEKDPILGFIANVCDEPFEASKRGSI
jgi:hypothetical protein